MVTWDPTWEPEEMTIHADYEVLEYLMNRYRGLILSTLTEDTSRLILSTLTEDTSLDNLTRQGFSKVETSVNP